MDSKKRPEPNEADSTASQKPGKRQRVTRACDPCRLAREKCDGAQPKCLSCTEQKRECRYTPTAKKRGVPTGYLKTIELSLAWLIEENPTCETALNRLLDGGIQSARLLQCLSQDGHRLQQRWSNSSIHESIGKLLSNDVDSSTESPGASETEVDEQSLVNQEQPQELSQGDPKQPSIKLPPNWRALIDIYRSHTHCWFPLVSMADVVDKALTYPKEGIKPGLTETPSEFAELWAVLALAAFQDPLPSTESSMASSQELYSTARSLIPSERQTFEAPHLRALLLHSLVLIGQGAELAAWLLIGTATRLSLHLKCTGLLLDDGGTLAGHRMRAACFILDTLASASLGYASTFNPASASIIEIEFELRRWKHTATPDMMPKKSFFQLFRFCCFMGQRARGTLASLPTVPDLVESLDPVFAFCNNILSDAESSSPSALLIQIAFLVTSVQLSRDNGFRTSLATNLIEVVECCTTSLGLKGTPPLVIGLLGIFRRSQHFTLLHECEKMRWQTVTNSLRASWARQKQGSGVVAPAAEHHDHTYSHNAGMRSGLLSPDLSTLSTSEYETIQPPSSWQYIHSPLETPGKSFLQESQWEIDLEGLFSSPSMEHADLAAGSLESNGSARVSQATEDVTLKELDTFCCPPELGVDARMIRNLGLGVSDLSAMGKTDSGR